MVLRRKVVHPEGQISPLQTPLLNLCVEKVLTGSGTELDRRLGYTSVRVLTIQHNNNPINPTINPKWKAERGRGGFGPGLGLFGDLVDSLED